MNICCRKLAETKASNKMIARFFSTLLLSVMIMSLSAQQTSQKIKGRVLDMDTHNSLPGVNVFIVGSNPLIGASTDAEGYFLLENVPVGRYTIQFSFMGYDAAIFKEIALGSGKEVVLNVLLKESFQQLGEVTVKPQFRKDKAMNKMASLSARSFSVEEASRYAGGWNDPSRLAGAFAGVSMAEGVNDNAIVVRGNAPKGILWRLEGVEIPAPNHLNGVNNGGGIETVFSVNMLDNSDFFTGAFPAEYGNAMSGAFDMNFRNGNSDKRESTFQIGTQGIDIGSEGPLKKGSKASYLFNYRYSTLGLMGKLGGGDFGLPEYQDLSFKLHLPTPGAGTFSVWGIGGLSSVAFDPDDDPDKWENSFDNNKYDTGSDIGAAGISHHIKLGKSSYLNTSWAATYSRFDMKSDQLQRDQSVLPLAEHKEDNTKMVMTSFLNSKVSRKHTNRTGVTYTRMNYDLDILGNTDVGIEDELVRIAKQSGNADQWQFYTQSKWRLSSTFDVNAGVNFSYLNMNEEFVAEPRLGARWRFSPKHSFSLAYGKHSRLEPIRFYQAKNEDQVFLNPDLKVTKAQHYVFAYDYRINENMKLKIEPYYQQLYDVPEVEGTSKSLINYTWDMYFDAPLSNEGEGSNIGVDITLERYMKDGMYYMFTGSVFDSKYKNSDGIERNTSFNRNYVFNLLGGKEWEVHHDNVFGINAKLSLMGGNRFTPPNQEASAVNEMVVLDESRAYEWQENSKCFLDLAFSYRVNKENRSNIFSLQVKNVLMQSEMFGWAYDFEEQRVVAHGLTMMYPYFTYRIEF